MDTILSFFTSNDSDNLPNVIPSRDIFLQTETYNKFTGGAEYNKNTYIGHLKIKNGGMKIIKDDHDKLIGKERNIVLKHLHDSLNGGNLDHTNIELYYKALEGGYIRALMCPGGNDSETCKNANYNNLKAGYKLSKHALKNGNFQALKTFKHNAPKLYQNLKDSGQVKRLKYKRDKYLNRLSDGGSVKSDGSLSVHLSKLRNTVGTRNLNETGGDLGISRSEMSRKFRDLENERFYELEALRNRNKGRVSNLSSPRYGENENFGGDISRTELNNFLREQQNARFSELENLRSKNQGRVRRLSTPESSPASSPRYDKPENFNGGGDPLQKLRMELGRL